MDLGELAVRLKADLKNFSAGMKLATTQIKTFGEQAGRQMRRASDAIRRFSARALTDLRNFANRMARYLKYAALAASAAIIKLGSDAEESENLFSVAFEDMADSVREWSDVLADKLKISAHGVRENAANFQLFLTSLDLGSEKAAKMSESLTELVYDMSSLRNLKFDETLRKIQAGLAGEIEPLRRIGINVNQVALEQWALKHGLDANFAAWTEQQKVIARAGVIYEAAAKDIGDMGRTAGSVTNLMRSVTDQLKELAIEIYEKWRPHIQAALAAIRDFVVKNRTNIAEAIGHWTDGFVGFVSWMRQDFAGAMKGALDILLELFKAFGKALLVVMQDVGARAAQAFKQKFAADLSQWLIEAAKPDGVLGWLSTAIPGVAAARIGMAKAAVELKKMSLEAPANRPDLGKQLAGVYAEMRKNIERIKAAMPALTAPLQEELTAGLDTTKAKIEEIEQSLVNMHRNVTPAIQQATQKWKDLWADASSSIAGAMQTAFADIVEDVRNATQAITSMLRQIQRAISEAVFRQYLMEPIFQGINALGIPLKSPTAQATAVQQTQFQPTYHQYGGFRPKNTDKIPAMISPGEAVLPERVVDILRQGLGAEGPAAPSRPVTINVQAIDGVSAYRFLSSNKRVIAALLSSEVNQNSAARRSTKWRR